MKPLFFLLLLFPSAALAQQKRGSIQLLWGGSLGFTQMLNDRVQEGVSQSGVSMAGCLRLTARDVLFPGGLRGELTLRDTLFFGTANIAGIGLHLGYEGQFAFLERPFIYGVGFGFSYNHAPTNDAASLWTGFSLKADIATPVKGYLVGLFVKYEQLLMGDAADPLMVTLGVEVLLPLWRSRHSEGRSKPLRLPKTKPPAQPEVQVDPQDPDGDGVKGSTDLCPDTKRGRKVKENGCRPLFDGMQYDELVFPPQKASLSPAAHLEVKRLAQLLRANPTVAVVVTVYAHDAILARKRADLIEKALREMQIPASRIKTAPQVGKKEEVSFTFLLGT